MFSQDGKLRIHLKTHTCKKPSYSCDQCPKFFSQDDKLRIHLRTNTCKKPSYSCNQCPKFFSQDGKLIIHLKTNHLYGINIQRWDTTLVFSVKMFHNYLSWNMFIITGITYQLNYCFSMICSGTIYRHNLFLLKPDCNWHIIPEFTTVTVQF